MKEIQLNQNDIKRIKDDIKLSSFFGLIFIMGIVLLLGIIAIILFLIFIKPKNGFMQRSLYILGFLFLPFIGLSFTNILKYLDIKRGKKKEIQSSNYEIHNKTNSAFISLKDNNGMKIKIFEDLIPLIDANKSIRIEIASLSKYLLFISNDSKNLLED